MRFPPASDIKRIRKSMDVTQSELSRMSGVGQSTIAKIEGGRTSASYETVVKLFETLEQMRRGQGSDMKAMDVASTKIVSIESSALVHQASDLMRRTGYSQLPVIDSGVSVGSISERGIFELLREGSTMEDLAHQHLEGNEGAIPCGIRYGAHERGHGTDGRLRCCARLEERGDRRHDNERRHPQARPSRACLRSFAAMPPRVTVNSSMSSAA